MDGQKVDTFGSLFMQVVVVVVRVRVCVCLQSVKKVIYGGPDKQAGSLGS